MRIRRQLPTFLLAFILLFQMQAQDGLTLKNVSDYQPGEQKINNLFLCFSSPIRSTGGIRQFSLSPSLSANFSSFKNSNKKQTWVNLEASSLGSIRFGSNSRRIRILNVGLNASIKNRNYLSRKFYLESGLALNATKGELDQKFFTANGSLGLGYGRLNNLNDIQTAQNLITSVLQDKADLIQVEDAKIIELAHFIRTLKNERKLANRADIESELPLIKDKLQELNINLSASGIEELILDGYKFEPLINRFNGTTVTLSGVTSTALRNFGLSQSSFDYKNVNAGINLNLDHRKYINEKWQVDFNTSLFYSESIYNQYNETNFTTPRPYTGLSSELTVNYFKDNSRRFSTSLGTTYSRDLEFNNNHFSNRLSFEYEKRVSRNMSTTLGLDISYRKGLGFIVGPTIKLKF